MIQGLVEHLAALPEPLITFVIATLPVSELRGAIPWALTGGGLQWQQAYFYAVLGNFLPVIPLLLLLEPISLRLRKYGIWNKFFSWLFERTRRRSRVVERFEVLGLILFVAIPLPVTGAWTGTVAAFLFGIRFRLAVLAILAGIFIAGAVVTLASLGILGAVSHFLVGR